MKLRDLYAMAVQIETRSKIKIFKSFNSFHYRHSQQPDFEFNGWDAVPQSFKNDKVLIFAIEDNTLYVAIKEY